MPANGDNQQQSMVVSGSQRQMKGYDSDRWWWTAMATDGGGRLSRSMEKRINWYEVRKIIVRRYKIESEKIGTK